MATFDGWRLTRTGVVFVVGVVVLAALVFAGIWYVQQRGEQARRAEAIKVAEETLKDQSEIAVETKPDNGAVNSGTVNPQTGSSTTTNSTTTNTATELPATGPEIANIAIITVLALSVAYYMASRRAADQL